MQKIVLYLILKIFNFKTFRAESLQIFELLIWKIINLDFIRPDLEWKSSFFTTTYIIIKSLENLDLFS